MLKALFDVVVASHELNKAIREEKAKQRDEKIRNSSNDTKTVNAKSHMSKESGHVLCADGIKKYRCAGHR